MNFSGGSKRATTLSSFGAFICLLVILSGCSKEKEQKPEFGQVEEVALEKSKVVAQSDSIRCDSDASCSESIALVSVATVEGVRHCIGFLSAPDQLITSGLCLASQGSPTGGVRSCEEQVFIYFPETGKREAVRARCAGVEQKRVPTKELEPSYAVLRLDQSVKREPLKLSYYGLLDQEQVRVYDIAQKSGKTDLRLVQKDCRVIHDSILIPGATSARSSMLVMSGCELSDASLGAPVIGREGSVRGIASKVFADSERLRLGLVTQDIPLFSDLFESASYVTNMACLKIGPGLNDADYPECDFPISGGRAFDDLNRKLKERSDQTVSMRARAWTRNADSNFRYRTEKAMPNTVLGQALSRFTYDPGNLVSQHYQLPVCIEDKKALLENYKRSWPYFGGKYPETAEYESLVVPVWQVRMGVDSNTRFVYVTRQRRMDMHLHITFNPRELEDTGKTNTVITYKDELNETFEIYRGDFGLCFEE